jgi:nascent polypeptide-associated complex subunit alpha
MQAMMRKLGISTENLDATEVLIKCRDRTLRVKSPEVVKMKVQGQEMYQISGRTEVLTGEAATTAEAAAEAPASFSDEDIEIVMSQTGASREGAVKALTECDGAPAEAIVHLLSKKK